MSKLAGMSFTLQMDRVINLDRHYISPGGYVLNGKNFDFKTSVRECVDGEPTKVVFWVEDLDGNVVKENAQKITEEDCKSGEFSEFYVYTGEPDEEMCGVLSVSDLHFRFDDDRNVEPGNDSITTRSANACINQFTSVIRDKI